MIEAMPAVAMRAAISAWRRRLGGTEVRLEAVRTPAAAVISISVVDEFAETRGADGSDGEGAVPAADLDGGIGAPDWAPAPIAGRYRIGEHLATSRLGHTYLARDPENDEDVEVTFLFEGAVVDAGEAAARLEQLQSLRHLHVLPLLDWQLDPVPYLVYPAPAIRLDSLISAGAALSPSQTLLIGLQAAETLDNLREQGIAHGALTPAHFCLDARGRLRLAEVGVDFLRTPRDPGEPSPYDDPWEDQAVEQPTAPSAAAEVIALVEDFESTGAPVDDPQVGPEQELAEELAELTGAPAAGLVELTGDPAAADDLVGSPAELVEDSVELPAGPADCLPAPADEESGLAEDPDLESEQGAGSPPTAGSAPIAESPPERDRAAAAAAADVYALGLTLADAATGRLLAPADIGRIGRSVVPAGASAATVRNLSRLAPLLVQATAARPEKRLGIDEFALALRATAEMFPPPDRLDEAFRRVEETGAEPTERAEARTVPDAEPGRARDLLTRLVTAAAVVAAGALLVIYAAGGDETPSHLVPSVVGMDWVQADETLAASGWEVRRLEVRVPDAPAGEVVGQLPEPGGLLDEGQVVKVQVTLGEPLVVIPADIVGMSLEEAGLRLSEIGLRLGAIHERVDASVPEGAVVDIAEPLPELPRGSQVDLVIAVAG